MEVEGSTNLGSDPALPANESPAKGARPFFPPPVGFKAIIDIGVVAVIHQHAISDGSTAGVCGLLGGFWHPESAILHITTCAAVPHLGDVAQQLQQTAQTEDEAFAGKKSLSDTDNFESAKQAIQASCEGAYPIGLYSGRRESLVAMKTPGIDKARQLFAWCSSTGQTWSVFVVCIAGNNGGMTLGIYGLPSAVNPSFSSPAGPEPQLLPQPQQMVKLLPVTFTVNQQPRTRPAALAACSSSIPMVVHQAQDTLAESSEGKDAPDHHISTLKALRKYESWITDLAFRAVPEAIEACDQDIRFLAVAKLNARRRLKDMLLDEWKRQGGVPGQLESICSDSLKELMIQFSAFADTTKFDLHSPCNTPYLPSSATPIASIPSVTSSSTATVATTATTALSNIQSTPNLTPTPKVPKATKAFTPKAAKAQPSRQQQQTQQQEQQLQQQQQHEQQQEEDIDITSIKESDAEAVQELLSTPMPPTSELIPPPEHDQLNSSSDGLGGGMVEGTGEVLPDQFSQSLF